MARPERRRRSGAFTLLEVLCAVVVLAIFLTMLGRASSMGLLNEGESVRRTKASLLADREIEGIETSLALGQAPRVGSQEDDRDGMRVKVEVKPFDAAAAGLHSAPPLAGDQPTQNLPPGPPKGLLAPSTTGANPLLWVTVHVAWNEGVYEREVSRSTLLYDPTAAAPLLAPLAAQGAGIPPGGEAQPGGTQPPPPATPGGTPQ